jgi:hypothetical protein
MKTVLNEKNRMEGKPKAFNRVWVLKEENSEHEINPGKENE